MPKITSKDTVKLKSLMLQPGKEKTEELIRFLLRLGKLSPDVHSVLPYHNTLIFGLAHAHNPTLKRTIQSELTRISGWLHRNSRRNADSLVNTGLLHSQVYSFFSWTTTQWLVDQDFDVHIEQFPESDHQFNDLLMHTLPASEKDVCGLGLNNSELISALGIKETDLLRFILGQIQKLKASEEIKAYFFDKLQLTIKLNVNHPWLTKEGNTFNPRKYYYQKDWLKKFDVRERIQNGNFSERMLSLGEKQRVMETSRISLIMLQRETDPVKQMDETRIRFFEMDRGISVALFSMKTEFQLYPEIYFGHTLYKNGIPAAYGGAWIFGNYSLFGVNILEWCRGGESNLMVSELLMLYHQVLEVKCFEVEPYQYGKDNPEGISSGAFWFYYRMGFRPVRKDLAILAKKEQKKILEIPGYKSSPKTLLKFTEGSIRMELGKVKLIRGANIKSKIKELVKIEFNSDRVKAEIKSTEWMKKSLPALESGLNQTVLTETAMMNRAVGFPISKNKELLIKLLQSRNENLFEYQKYLIQWLQLVQLKA